MPGKFLTLYTKRDQRNPLGKETETLPEKGAEVTDLMKMTTAFAPLISKAQRGPLWRSVTLTW